MTNPRRNEIVIEQFLSDRERAAVAIDLSLDDSHDVEVEDRADGRDDD